MNRVVAALALAAAAVAVLSSCARELPPYAEVKAETDGAIQAIIAALPEGFDVEDRSGTPYGCAGGRGLFYTAHWVAKGPSEFDGQAFVDALPELIGDDFVVDDSAPPALFPMVRLASAEQPDLFIDVITSRPGQEPFVDLLGISRCGKAPSN